MNFPRNTPVTPVYFHSDLERDFYKWWNNQPESKINPIPPDIVINAWREGWRHSKVKLLGL